jgi:phytanoyl-CoA hydroxylase
MATDDQLAPAPQRLTDDDVVRYHERGYLAVDDVLSAADVAELRAVTDDFAEQSRLVSEHTDVFDLEPGHTAQRPRLRRLKMPHKRHEAYDRVLRDDRILDIVSKLIGPGIRFQTTKLNLKSPEYGSGVEWHQDWAFYPHTNDDLLAVGVAIDDMTAENGCLMVVPGSHRGPVHDHHQNGFFAGAARPDGMAEKAVPIELRAGGISLHHTRLVHGSAPNTSSRPRRLLLFEYAAADAWPLLGFTDWEDFNVRLLRGSVVSEPRLAPVPVRIPLPTHDRQGSIYEVQSIVKDRAFTG